jgi:hypothetical protein
MQTVKVVLLLSEMGFSGRIAMLGQISTGLSVTKTEESNNSLFQFAIF